MLPLVRIVRASDLLKGLPQNPGAWLSASELQRLQKLQQSARRDHYLAGHWLARCLLAELHGGAAADYHLEDRPSLPPMPSESAPAVQISLSHSGDWIAAALAEGAIGIDIEQRQPGRDALLGFQQILLAEGEAEHSLDSDQLLQRWVLKEAWIKRHHGSALPDQLARIRLRACAPEHANVIASSTTELHFAVSADRLNALAYAIGQDATAGYWFAEG